MKEERDIWIKAVETQRMDTEEEKIAKEVGISINDVLDAVINVHDNTLNEEK